MRKNNVLTYLVIAVAVVVAIIIFLWIVLHLFNATPSVSNGDAIVLAFFGILATFIVVGNYAQVLNIQKQMDDKVRDLEKDLNGRISNLNNKIGTIDASIQDGTISIMKHFLETDNRVPDLQKLMVELLSSDNKDALLAAFLDEPTEFQITYKDGTSCVATAHIRRGKFELIEISSGIVITRPISTISGNNYDLKRVQNIVALYLKLKKNKSLENIFGD